MLPAATTESNRRSVNRGCRRASGRRSGRATRPRARRCEPRAKSVSADLVTDADGKAEARRASTVLRAHRPDDAIVGRGGHRPRGHRRRAAGGSTASTAPSPSPSRPPGGWCSAVALEDERGPAGLRGLRPGAGELYAAARGEGATVDGGRRVARPRPLRRGPRRRLPPPGPARQAGRPRDRAPRCSTPPACSATPARARSSSPGSPPAASTPGSSPTPTRGTGSPAPCWSPRPAATRRVVQRETRWHIAGPSALVDELVALLT